MASFFSETLYYYYYYLFINLFLYFLIYLFFEKMDSEILFHLLLKSLKYHAEKKNVKDLSMAVIFGRKEASADYFARPKVHIYIFPSRKRTQATVPRPQ